VETSTTGLLQIFMLRGGAIDGGMEHYYESATTCLARVAPPRAFLIPRPFGAAE